VSTSSIWNQLRKKIRKSKRYRDAFVEHRISEYLPLKIRAIREDRELSQKELGELFGKAQSWISKLEDPNYARFTLTTLLQLAAAFNVALKVDFVPFSELLGDVVEFDEKELSVPQPHEDLALLCDREETAQVLEFYLEGGPIPQEYISDSETKMGQLIEGAGA